MRKYLIFFGKSQDFIYFAFDEHGLIQDFNEVIKDFSLLESTYFTVDTASNEQILAKYNFKTSNGGQFSLLKLYSFAQAVGGSRVDRSIYGVALLSDHDVCISLNNNNLLKNAKETFASYSLTKNKFNKSNFFDDVNNIFNTFITKYRFDDIEVNGKPTISDFNIQKGFYTPDLFIDSVGLGSEINNNCSRLYFSDDLLHLKRTLQQWGDKFPVYHNLKGEYVRYKEEDKPVFAATSSRPVTVVPLGAGSDLGNAKPSDKLLQLPNGIILIASLLLNIVFFINIVFFNNSEKKIEIPQPKNSKAGTIEDTGVYNNVIKIDTLLNNSKKIKSLSNFCLNIIQFKNLNLNKSDDVSNSSQQAILFEKIEADAKILGLDSAVIDRYKPLTSPVAPVEKLTGASSGTYPDIYKANAKENQSALGDTLEKKKSRRATTTKKKPEPATSATKLEPATSATKPEPATAVTKQKPVTAATKPEPATSATKQEPATSATKPEPATSATKQEPATAATKPKPVTAAKGRHGSTAVK